MSPILKILTVGGVSRPAAAVLRGSGRDSGHGHGDDDGGDVGDEGDSDDRWQYEMGIVTRLQQ